MSVRIVCYVLSEEHKCVEMLCRPLSSDPPRHARECRLRSSFNETETIFIMQQNAINSHYRDLILGGEREAHHFSTTERVSVHI